MRRPHSERHRVGRVGWLRAAVLGANDGVVSTASLMIGVAAAAAGRTEVLVAGLAGLVAGAMSMAAGEYVSVSSQRDAERADIARERREHRANPALELEELTEIYRRRGLEPALAREVATQLERHDAIGAHLRDELGLTELTVARPWQAAAVSAGSFALAAIVPVLVLLAAPRSLRIPVLAATCLAVLAALGWLGGRLGGAPQGRAAARVLVGGGLAMGASAVIGRIVGAAV